MIRQIRSTLFPAEKFALIRISGLVFLASLLELGGIGLVMPIIALFLNPELFDQNRILIQIKQMTGNLPYNSLLILLCTATALFFLCKNLFLYWIAGVQIRFAYRLSARLGADLLERYIGGGYRFRLSESSARSLEKLNQTRNALPDLFNSLMMLASEVLLVMILLAAVFVLAPLTAVGIAVVAVFFSIPVFLLVRRLIRSIAEVCYEENSRLTGFLLFVLGALKEIKLAGRKERFIREGRELEFLAAEPAMKLFLYSQLPRFFIEAGVICFGMGTIILLLVCRVAPTSIALQISFIGLALLRMMPSMSRIHYYLARIRSQWNWFALISTDLNTIPAEDETNAGPELKLEREIRVEKVSFAYGEKPVLKDLSLTIPKNSSLALAGPTGCGKTTLSDLISGLFPPDSGRILVDGRDIRENLGSWRRQIGYVPQTITLLEGTVAENVAPGVPKEQIDRARVAECLRIAQAEEFVLRLPGGMDCVLTENGRNLSGGQRQRIGIARALYPHPAFLIFDEATSSLDNQTESAFVEALTALRGRVTMLVVAHRQTSIEHCDRVFRFP